MNASSDAAARRAFPTGVSLTASRASVVRGCAIQSLGEGHGARRFPMPSGPEKIRLGGSDSRSTAAATVSGMTMADDIAERHP